MLNFSNLFKLLDEKGIQYVSNQTGISTGNICDWKSGRSKPNAESLVKMAKALNCSVDYLLGRTNMKEFVKDPSNVIKVPVLPQKAAAGLGKEVTDDSFDPPEDKWFYEDQVPSGTDYGIIIEGHSMEDKFFHKQIVFIQFGRECAPSDCGIFSVTDEIETKIYCKQLMQRENGGKYLHSLNTHEGDPDIDYKNVVDIHCIGKILG